MFCDECSKYSELIGKKNAVKVEQSPSRFVFTVESTGVMKPGEIIKKAFTILKQKLKNVQNSIHPSNIKKR